MLLDFGNGPVVQDWMVSEKIPPGFCRVYYIQSGDITYQDTAVKQTLVPGESYVFPSLSTYQITHNPQRPLVCTFVHLDLMPLPVLSLIPLRLKDNLFWQHLMDALQSAVILGNRNIVASLCDSLVIALKEQELVTLPSAAITRALIYIEKHLSRPVSIRELSAQLGYNEQYFIRLFKKHIGTTPGLYILNQKLKQAVAALTQGCSVTQTAHQLGFSDIKTFSLCFRRKFGVSPTAYVKRARTFAQP